MAIEEAAAAAAQAELDRIKEEAEAAEAARKAEEEANKVIVPEVITEPIDCLTQSAFFGAATDTTGTTDMLHINKVGPNSVITSLRVCTDSNRRNVLGIQLYYARYVNGRLTGEFSMERHGLLDENEIVMC